MGVVRSLLRAGFAHAVRDVRRRGREREAAALGATCHASPAALVAACEIAIVLVVDAAQVDDVLFGRDRARRRRACPRASSMIASTVDPIT
mgnify:CR=1 FL=1